MGKNQLRKNLLIINDVQDRVYRRDSRVIWEDSTDRKLFRDAVEKQCNDKARRANDAAYLSIIIMGSVGGLICGILARVYPCSYYGILPVPVIGFGVSALVGIILMIVFMSMSSYYCQPHGFNDALAEWYGGAYRESTWYQGLDSDEKAHVIGIIESKPYSIISERVRSMESPAKYNMGPTVSMLDHEILNNETVLASDMADAYTRDKLRGMIRMYESYRSRLLSDDRSEPLPPITKGMTDLMQDDEKTLADAVDEYNDEVRLATRNEPILRAYESMLRKYRETLVHHPGYHSGSPTNDAISNAESIAYAGFTM